MSGRRCLYDRWVWVFIYFSFCLLFYHPFNSRYARQIFLLTFILHLLCPYKILSEAFRSVDKIDNGHFFFSLVSVN